MRCAAHCPMHSALGRCHRARRTPIRLRSAGRRRASARRRARRLL
jgi:hypothetical protein